MLRRGIWMGLRVAGCEGTMGEGEGEGEEWEDGKCGEGAGIVKRELNDE